MLPIVLIAGYAAVAPAFAQPVHFPGNGNHYEFIEGRTIWADARDDAATKSFDGVMGHLVTITSAAENAFLTSTFASGEPEFFSWIGGHEPADDGVWLWGAGPEIGVQFSSGGAPTPPYNYANWGGIEPNDHAPDEDYAAMNLGLTFAGIEPGEWGDAPDPGPDDPILGYLVEYETGVTGIGDGVPPSDRLTVRQNVPNPFGHSTSIAYSHGSPARVTVNIYDLRGRLVRCVRDRVEAGGSYSISWDGRDAWGMLVPAGLYMYAVHADKEETRRKLLLIR
jgi:hypothetical protein